MMHNVLQCVCIVRVLCVYCVCILHISLTLSAEVNFICLYYLLICHIGILIILVVEMTKINKDIRKKEMTRNRVRIFRGMQSILRQERKVNIESDVALNVSVLSQNLRHQTQKSLADQLRTWSIEYHVQRRALSKLLKILISFGLNFLPKDSRTLLVTPRSVNIENRAGGQYWHNGLKIGLKSIFSQLTSNLNIDMNINIDGLPLFKSSPVEFWPILGNIRGTFSLK